MRHLLWAALFLLYCTFGCFAAVVQQLPRKGKSGLQTYVVSDTEKNGESWKPIRITVSGEDVDKVIKNCNRKRAIAKRLNSLFPNSDEEKVLCDNTTGITDAKKEVLLKKLLPAAIKLHTDRLSIQREEGKVVISASNVDKISRECSVTITGKHKTEGFPGADFVFFVGIAVSRTPTRVCSQEPNERPTSALIQFVPKDIVDTRHFVRTAAHEMAHGLGFVVSRMERLKMIKYGPVESNGKAMAVYSAIMLDKIKEHYDCEVSLITGMYLEDEGDSHDRSHWERRIAKDELMSPYTGEPSGMYYTALTLAAFHSMSFYSANFTMAEPMSWGNKSGCDLLRTTCKRNMDGLMNHTSMFCSENKSVLQCTSDHFALGICSSISVRNTLSQEYHYFERVSSAQQDEMTNYCPIIKPFKETTCESGNVTLMPGSIVSNISRCLNVKEPKFNEGDQSNDVSVHGICANVKCENDTVYVHYKGMNDGEWHKCEEDDREIILQGSAFSGGKILCPKYKEVCTGLPEIEPLTIEHDDVSDNSNASEIPPHNMDSSQKDDSSKPGSTPETEDSQHPDKTPQDEDSRKAENPPKEGGSSKPESSDNNEREKDTTDGEVENTNNRTGVISGKDSDNSIAVSFFGPLMLLVCAVAAVVAL